MNKADYHVGPETAALQNDFSRLVALNRGPLLETSQFVWTLLFADNGDQTFCQNDSGRSWTAATNMWLSCSLLWDISGILCIHLSLF